MSSRRVESLIYQLETDDTVSFDAAPIEHETNAFSLRLEDDKLTVDLHEHFSSVGEARERVDLFLEAWEVKYGLQVRQGEISFSYKDREVIREDTGKDEVTLAGGEVELERSASTSFHVEHPEYPDPPDKFRPSPDARTLWGRYKSYEEGRERLFAMGYACLNFLEGRAGGGKRAVAKKYNISRRLLQKLGTLTSARGSPEVARKPSDSEATPDERKWIEKAVRQIVFQVGISDAGHDPEKLTKDDLPPLP